MVRGRLIYRGDQQPFKKIDILQISFEGVDMSQYEINIKSFPALRVASLWGKGLPFAVTVPNAYEDLAAWMAEKLIPPLSGSPMGLALYYDDPASIPPRRCGSR